MSALWLERERADRMVGGSASASSRGGFQNRSPQMAISGNTSVAPSSTLRTPPPAAIDSGSTKLADVWRGEPVRRARTAEQRVRSNHVDNNKSSSNAGSHGGGKPAVSSRGGGALLFAESDKRQPLRRALMAPGGVGGCSMGQDSTHQRGGGRSPDNSVLFPTRSGAAGTPTRRGNVQGRGGQPPRQRRQQLNLHGSSGSGIKGWLSDTSPKRTRNVAQDDMMSAWALQEEWEEQSIMAGDSFYSFDGETYKFGGGGNSSMCPQGGPGRRVDGGTGSLTGPCATVMTPFQKWKRDRGIWFPGVAETLENLGETGNSWPS